MTLDLAQASEYLKISADALMRKARAGIVPGARIGRRWVFLKGELDKLIMERSKAIACRSIAEIRVPTGGCDSQSVALKLDAALARQTVLQQKSSRLALEVAYGDRRNSGRNPATPGKKPLPAGTPRLRLVGGNGTRSV